MTSIRVRFAPSPTGKLHVGNARVALINWLFAKKHGGEFILRLDDTDDERSTEAFAEGIQKDLKWLNLEWQVFDRQSKRMARYQWAFEKLLAEERLYPCFETPEELALKRKVQLAQHKPPIYDRAALALTTHEKQTLLDKGIKPHWRFLLNHGDIHWHDAIKGDLHFQGGNLSDPVLFRSDNRPIYTLASVVDDIDFNISHVFRGDDHITNTAAQIQLTEALGGTPPVYGHLPLLTNAAGEGLSKRLGSLSLEHLRDNEGIEAMALNSHLTKLGSSDPIEAKTTLDELVTEFDLKKYSPSTARFDEQELLNLNAHLLQGMPFTVAVPKLRALGINNANEAFWQAVRGNITKFRDVEGWYKILCLNIEPVLRDLDLTTIAAALLPQEVQAQDVAPWLFAVKEKTGRKGAALYMPIRLALTGQEHGPELSVLLPLLGSEKARSRLKGSYS
ncbi:MAG: glutamate--tRNA ligase [Holosporales bacterium]|jgi:glutamyl-tRNA synthetase